MELHFVVNEFAGNGKGKSVWQQLQKELTTAYTYTITKYTGHATAIAKQICEKTAYSEQSILLVAIGGDGTIHEVLNGVIGYQNIFVGAVCAGSGNDFSRGYTSFKTAQQIEGFLSECSYQEMDCGEIQLGRHKKYFINNTGIGFDAFVAYKTNQSKIKKRLNKFGLGKLSYIYFVLYCLVTYKLFNLNLQQNGEQKSYEKVWFATVSNQPYFGGGMKISPKSRPNDGVLELTIVYNLSRIKLLIMFVTVFFGAHTRLKEVIQLSGDSFTLYVDEQLPCHTDGEIIGTTNSESAITYTVSSKSWKIAKI